jgi:DNA ligase D-like protein (predicted 3'-phosphoesterase)
MPRDFVIHDHHATHHHYDLRLEKDGVLKSWAVPRGVPLHTGDKRLAVEVDDHDLDYLKFEGTIEKGYGAGTVAIYDIGKYEEVSWNGGKIVVKFHGNIVEGKYVLVKMPKPGEEDNWLIFKVEGK